MQSCVAIQKARPLADGSLDPRYLIPIISSLERDSLVKLFPALIKSDDVILKAALARMRERLARSYNQFREGGGLKGMTTCEQLTFLHDMNAKELKSEYGISQAKYLGCITERLDDTDNFTDRVAMASLDFMIMRAIKEATKAREDDPAATVKKALPLAFMRTTMICINKHPSLRAYLCNTLLKKLIHYKIWECENREYEGFKRAMIMLATEETPNSVLAMTTLPSDKLCEIFSHGTCSDEKKEKIYNVLARNGCYDDLDEEVKNLLSVNMMM